MQMPVVEALPTTTRLLGLISAMESQPVLMAVDLVADRFITGSPKRISREAPVLILTHESDRFVPGGGANAVANVAALGGRPLVMGVLGDDESGRALVRAFDGLGIPTSGVTVLPGYRTPTKVRIMGGGKHSIKQQIVRYDIEDTAPDNETVAQGRREALARWKGEARVAVMSDYGYGGVTPDLIPAVRTALDQDGFLLCDSRYRLGDFSDIDGATPNEEEAEALYGQELGEDPEALRLAGDLIRDRLGAKYLLVTRGRRGMTLFESGQAAHVPIHGTDQVADVTGAGDTVIGTFALATAAGASPIEAATLANFAGSVVVQKSGTATVNQEELSKAVATGTETLEGIRWESL